MKMTPEQIQFTIALCLALFYFATQFVIALYENEPSFIVLGVLMSSAIFVVTLNAKNETYVIIFTILLCLTTYIRGIFTCWKSKP